MEPISRAVLIGVVVLAGILLLTPYEDFLEALIATGGRQCRCN